MERIKIPNSQLINISYTFLFIAFFIVTFRSSLHFLIYDLSPNKYFFKISIAIVFILLFVSVTAHSIKIKLYDYIFIFLGSIFIFYNIIFFDFRGIINSFFYFFGVYVFYPHLKFYRIFHNFFIFSSIYVSIEVLLEFLFFNGKSFGLDFDLFISYKEFVLRFNPFNGNAGVTIGPYFRLDGIFGNHQLTGSYLAVSSAYFFGYMPKKRYICLFVVNFVALILTLSTISVIACISSIVVLSIINFRRIILLLVLGLISISYNTEFIQMLINRLINNLSNEEYIKSFLFDNKGHLYQFIFGFNNRVTFENDIIEMLFYFGIIPTILLFIRFINPIFSKRKLLFRVPIFTSCSLAVTSGLITLLHQGGIIGWHIGIHFLFMSALLINYSKNHGIRHW